MNEIDIEALLHKRQEEFIENRTRIETEVNKFLESLKSTDEDVQRKCQVSDKTVRDWLPELWSDNFDIEVYEQQLAELNAYIKSVYAVCEQINAEAIKCLES